MAYELQFNNDDTWNSDWISSVDTSFAFSAYLSKNTNDLWVTHTIDIPDTVSFVRFRIGAYQNGEVIGEDLTTFLYSLIVQEIL